MWFKKVVISCGTSATSYQGLSNDYAAQIQLQTTE